MVISILEKQSDWLRERKALRLRKWKALAKMDGFKVFAILASLNGYGVRMADVLKQPSHNYLLTLTKGGEDVAYFNVANARGRVTKETLKAACNTLLDRYTTARHEPESEI